MLLEEMVFYPAFTEQAGEEGKRLVSDTLQDQPQVKKLIETLHEIDDDTAFETGFHALARGPPAHHVSCTHTTAAGGFCPAALCDLYWSQWIHDVWAV